MTHIIKSFTKNYTEENTMKNYIHNYKDFFGKEITSKEIEAGYINYSTLASVFDHVICNDIAKFFYNYIDGEYQVPELVNGSDYDEENECCRDIFQYYIISRNGYEFLSSYTDEIVYYLPSLDIYVWGVCHYGMPWNGVYTNIKVELEEVN